MDFLAAFRKWLSPAEYLQFVDHLKKVPCLSAQLYLKCEIVSGIFLGFF